VFIVGYFVIDLVWKLLNIPLYICAFVKVPSSKALYSICVSEALLPSLKQNLVQIPCFLELLISNNCRTYCSCLH